MDIVKIHKSKDLECLCSVQAHHKQAETSIIIIIIIIIVIRIRIIELTHSKIIPEILLKSSHNQ